MGNQGTTQAGEPIITLRNVAKAFDGKRVIDGLTLDIYRGETMVIMGGSGSGKSTTLRLMIGSIEADEGSICICGTDIVNANEDELNAVRLKLGVLFQSGALFNSMTLAENIALPLIEHTQLDREIIDIQVKIKLELVGLREHADKYPSEISGGMKKRAGLARALAMDPQMLFYDEPSAGLDPVTSAEIDRLIIDLSKKLGVTSIVITHEMGSAFAIADRIAMLDKGEMLMVEDKAWFARVRDTEGEAAEKLSEKEKLIRQFLRGDANGPITDRKAATNYAEDLLGSPMPRETTPSVISTRG